MSQEPKSNWKRGQQIPSGYSPSPHLQDKYCLIRHSREYSNHAEWGVLSGKLGDFIVKNYEDRDIPNPADVWIVDQRLFNATYERAATDQKEQFNSKPAL